MLSLLLAALAASPTAQTTNRAAVPLGGDYWKGTDVEPGEVWGVADLHAHFFNHLAFGGRVLHGAPAAPGGMRQALASCKANHGERYGRSTAILPEPAHATSGYPTFQGWPRYDTLVHQQAYVDWIRRAWQGGVRLVQVDVQNTAFLGVAYDKANGLFVRGPRLPVPVDDKSALRLQTGAARLLFNDGPASDFAALAYSADEARRIISSGKMAVVLGVEVEALENYAHERQLAADPAGAIASVVNELWEAGVRHVIPVHLTRNAFGHPGVFDSTLNVMNYADTGDFYATGDAFDAGVRFDPTRAHVEPLAGLVEVFAKHQGKVPFPTARAIGATEGLTDAGVALLTAMFRRGFIVDVEHLSDLGVNAALALAEEHRVPIMSSHAPFRDLSFGTAVTFFDGGFDAQALPYAMRDDADGGYGTSDAAKVRTDRSRARQQLERLRELGGVVGVPLVSPSVGVSWRGRVPLDCDGSSKGFLQQLLYAQEVLGTAGSVALASDVGGFARMPAPRFGAEACPGSQGDALRGANGRRDAQVSAQTDAVRYQTPLPGDLTRDRWAATQSPLQRSVAGTRAFDVNVDGMAHYGMFPDFLQDVANVAAAHGASSAVAPLFRSAEAYLRMWKRVEARARPPAGSGPPPP